MTSDPAAALELPWCAPVAALAPLRNETGTLLLLGGSKASSGRFSYLCALPEFMLVEEDPQRAMEALRAHRMRLGGQAGRFAFEGGFAGLFCYELGGAFERVSRPDKAIASWPAIALGWYPCVAVFDHERQRLSIVGEDGHARRLAAAITAKAGPVEAGPGELGMQWEEGRYLQAAARAVDYVRSGDVFQLNLSHPFRGFVPGRDGPFRLIERLACQSPTSHGAYFRLDEARGVVTNSPERFVKLSAHGRVETRPIKGTAPRHADPLKDASARADLQASQKDRAENLMIVDLMRNDLARCCVTGSVKVPDLFTLESFANVHHLVSTVTGQLEPDADIFDLIAASFPPGSITGAPKVRAMELIAELEGEARGPYCGALGWIGKDGSADLNVMIRTAAFQAVEGGWQVEARSGGAITIDSDPAEELEETRAKVSALARAIGDD